MSSSPSQQIGEATPAAQPANVLAWTPVDSVERVIDVQDFVEGTLRDKEMSVIYGRPNVGKTFLAIDMALHVALGKPWHGRVIEGGPAVYIALEGGHGAKNRIVAFREHHKVHGSIPMALINQSLALATPEGFGLLTVTMNEITARQGRPRLIVIDTLARAMAGLDENSTKDMSLFISYCDALREMTGAHICLIHHTGKDTAKGARGSSALLGGIDTEIELSREDGSPTVTASVTKQREMEKGADFYYSLKNVSIGVNRRGREVTSCVVVPSEVDMGSHAPFIPSKLRVAYDVLKNTFAAKSWLIHQQDGFPINCRVVNDEDFRRALAMAGMLSDKEETARQQHHRLRQGLIEAGLIRVHDKKIWQVKPQ